MTALITVPAVVPDVPHTAQISSPTSYCLFIHSHHTRRAVRVYHVREEADFYQKRDSASL